MTNTPTLEKIPRIKSHQKRVREHFVNEVAQGLELLDLVRSIDVYLEETNGGMQDARELIGELIYNFLYEK